MRDLKSSQFAYESKLSTQIGLILNNRLCLLPV